MLGFIGLAGAGYQPPPILIADWRTLRSYLLANFSDVTSAIGARIRLFCASAGYRLGAARYRSIVNGVRP